MPSVQRRHVHSRPRARLILIETQPPLLPDGVTIKRWATVRGVVFEEHIAPNGVIHWFKIENGAPPIG